jgi:predicted transcriptional regulator of viral defense system
MVEYLGAISTQGLDMRKSYREAEVIFRQHNGILRTSQARELGIDTRTVADMYQAGLLEKLGRGLYRLADLPPLAYPDLVQVAMRVSSAVICLISALSFHNLTTEIPHKVAVALPQSVRRPRIKYPPLDVVWLSAETYSAGIERHLLDGVSVPIYSKAKTIADCFKFRNKIGKDVALEALKEYVQLPDFDVEEQLSYARINRVEKVIQPYLEAVL